MPPRRSTKKQTAAQSAPQAAVIELPPNPGCLGKFQEVAGSPCDDMDVDPSAIYEERFFVLQNTYVSQIMQEFKAENAGPQLDKVLAYVETLAKLDNELEALLNNMNEKVAAYLSTGEGMAAVLSVQRSIDALQVKRAEAKAVPAGCNDLVKAYQRACSARLHGQ